MQRIITLHVNLEPKECSLRRVLSLTKQKIIIQQLKLTFHSKHWQMRRLYWFQLNQRRQQYLDQTP